MNELFQQVFLRSKSGNWLIQTQHYNLFKFQSPKYLPVLKEFKEALENIYQAEKESFKSQP